MVMKKQFHSIDGTIVGETSTGSARVDYLTDALGSVTATVNQSAQVVNTYRYTPYGSTLAKTGTGTDPAFAWCGEDGYEPTGNAYSEYAAMFRVVSDIIARWSSVDPIGLAGGDLNYMAYVGNSPVTWADPTGLQTDWGSGCTDMTQCKRLTVEACWWCEYMKLIRSGSMPPSDACQIARQDCGGMPGGTNCITPPGLPPPPSRGPSSPPGNTGPTPGGPGSPPPPKPGLPPGPGSPPGSKVGVGTGVAVGIGIVILICYFEPELCLEWLIGLLPELPVGPFGTGGKGSPPPYRQPPRRVRPKQGKPRQPKPPTWWNPKRVAIFFCTGVCAPYLEPSGTDNLISAGLFADCMKNCMAALGVKIGVP
jgi:RHS repeat-associated protein